MYWSSICESCVYLCVGKYNNEHDLSRNLFPHKQLNLFVFISIYEQICEQYHVVSLVVSTVVVYDADYLAYNWEILFVYVSAISMFTVDTHTKFQHFYVCKVWYGFKPVYTI